MNVVISELSLWSWNSKASLCRGCIFGCQYLEKKHSYTLGMF